MGCGLVLSELCRGCCCSCSVFGLGVLHASELALWRYLGYLLLLAAGAGAGSVLRAALPTERGPRSRAADCRAVAAQVDAAELAGSHAAEAPLAQLVQKVETVKVEVHQVLHEWLRALGHRCLYLATGRLLCRLCGTLSICLER